MTGRRFDEFEDWYGDLRPRLITAITSLGATRDIADDVADEALSKAYERWSEVSVMDNPAGWTYVVAKNAYRRRHRSGDITRKLGGLRHPHETDRDDVLVEFQALVEGLSTRQRHTVILKYVFGMTEVEIAKTLGVPRGTVTSRLRRSHEHLRRTMTTQRALLTVLALRVFA